MLKEIISQELESIEMDSSTTLEIEEVLAAGVGCKGSSCSGTCSPPVTA